MTDDVVRSGNSRSREPIRGDIHIHDVKSTRLHRTEGRNGQRKKTREAHLGEHLPRNRIKDKKFVMKRAPRRDHVRKGKEIG